MRNFSLLLFFLGLLAPTALLAQVDFYQTYGTPNHSETFARVRQAAVPGQYWAAGTTSSVGQDDCLLALLDADGNLLETDTLGSPEQNEALVGFDRDPQTGHFWLAGVRRAFRTDSATLFVWHLDAQRQMLHDLTIPLTTQWSSTYSYYNYGISVAVSQGKGAVVGVHQGDVNNAEYCLLRFDTSAQLLWQTCLEGYNGDRAEPLAPTPDGGWWVFTGKGQLGITYADVLLSRLNADGQVLWTQSAVVGGSLSVQALAFGVSPSDSSAVVEHLQVSGSVGTYLTKFDWHGNVRWRRPAHASTGNDLLLIDPDGGVSGLLGGRRLYLFDTQTGDSLDIKPLLPVGTSPSHGLILSGGELVLAGNIVQNQNSTDAYFARTYLPETNWLVESQLGVAGFYDVENFPWLAVGPTGVHWVGNWARYGTAGGYDFSLRKIAADGSLLWENNYGTAANDFLGDVAALSDGHCVLVGKTHRPAPGLPEALAVYKVAPDGTVVWEQRFSHDSLLLDFGALPTSDGGVVILYHLAYSTNLPSGTKLIQAMRLDSLGSPVWIRHYFLGQDNWAIRNFQWLSDGTMVATGKNDYGIGFVLHLDPADGAALEQDEPSWPGSNYKTTLGAALAPNGDLLVLSGKGWDSLFVYRVTNQALLYRKGLKIGDEFYRAALQQLSDGSLLVLVDYMEQDVQQGVWAWRLDDNLNVLEEGLLTGRPDLFSDCAPLPNGGLAVAGRTRPTNSYDLFLLKNASLPLVSAANVTPLRSTCTVSPNPFVDYFWLDGPLVSVASGSDNCTLEIRDLSGRLLRQQIVAGERIRVERGNLPAGWLVLTLRGNRGVAVSRVLALTGP